MGGISFDGGGGILEKIVGWGGAPPMTPLPIMGKPVWATASQTMSLNFHTY